MARQPERAVIVGGQQLTLAGVSSLQGRRNVIGLAEECSGTDRAQIDGFELPVADVDTNPATFTLDAAGLDLGTRTITFDCGDDVEAAFDLLVYRQNGAERGGANSIAIATAVGLASLVALFGLPAVFGEPVPVRRRDERPPPLYPPGQA